MPSDSGGPWKHLGAPRIPEGPQEPLGAARRPKELPGGPRDRKPEELQGAPREGH